MALRRASWHFSNKENRYLDGKDQSAGKNSCPNHPIFMADVTLNLICICNVKPRIGTPQILAL